MNDANEVAMKLLLYLTILLFLGECKTSAKAYIALMTTRRLETT
jgi:hypothetical protein